MSTLRRFLTLLTFIHLAVEAYQYNTYVSTADTVIQSRHYPKSYPPGLNVTWEFNVPSGKWGVIFTDFDLDVESNDSHDWLEIRDSGGKSVIYKADNRPLLHFISEGPVLTIHFVSDGLSDTNKRGFQLHILHGADKVEVLMKIHEATKKEKQPREESSSHLLIIIIAVLTFVAFVVIIIAVILLRRSSQDHRNENRNAFGIRRNSGISHSRRTRSTDEAPPNDGHVQPQDQQHEQQQRRPERTVQRSDSQLNWMARAELTNTLQKTGVSRPNAYTSTDVVKATPATARMTSSSSCTHNNVARSYENSVDEYCETADSLNHHSGTNGAMQEADYENHQPPSYEDSYLIPATREDQSPSLPQCYENLTPNACTGRQHQGTETNIYINTTGNADSRGSINEITIDTVNCIIKAKCGDTLEDKPPVNKSANNLETPATNIVIYKNLSLNTQQTCRPPSSSSIQIIDGYAFIVPSSAHASHYNSVSQLPNVDNEREPYSPGNSTMIQNVNPGNLESVQLPQEHSYTNAFSDIYINRQDT